MEEAVNAAKRWLRQGGAAEINSALTKLSGLDIGPVPIENLEITIPSGIDKKCLCELIKGAYMCTYHKYEDGEDTILIYIV